MARKRNEFDIKPVKRRLEKSMRSIPAKMGRIAIDHFDKSFRNQGFTDTTLQPWKRTKSGKRNSFGSVTRRAILIQSGRLRRGTRRAAITGRMVRIVNDVPYAEAHNEGVRANVKVSQHTREVKTFSYNYKTRKKTSGKKKVTVSSHIRKMNLPRRKFMGKSRMMNREIEKMIIKEVNSAFKPF